MQTRPMTSAQVGPLVIAGMLGIALSPLFPVIFLPIAAAALSGLAFRGRWTLAVSAAFIGALGISILDLTAAVFVFPVAFALLAAIVLLQRGRDVQVVGGGLIAIYSINGGIKEIKPLSGAVRKVNLPPYSGQYFDIRTGAPLNQ
jgi:hypothetical protein